MPSVFKHVGLVGKQRGGDSILRTLLALISLLKNRNITIYVEAETAAEIANDVDLNNLPVLSKPQLGKECDLIIVVGGDGSLLNVAHAVAGSSAPLLGINRGRLGFLTDISPIDLIEKVNEVLDGKFIEESRFLLAAHIFHQKSLLLQDNALNDVVLTPGAAARMIEFEIYINNRFVCSQRADGMIVATPTGSTAYALSGGGPILHPNLDAIVLVPMFPHTLSSRPIVVAGDSEITLSIATSNTHAPQLSCDGREPFSIAPGDNVTIRKKAESIRLIHLADYHYFETLRSKLQWEKKLTL